MDRFIDQLLAVVGQPILHLKSNMDRFIGNDKYRKAIFNAHLKSNMDRFIERYE